MPGNPHTSIRSRQAAAELRTLREQAGLSGAEVAKLLGMRSTPGRSSKASPPTVSEAELDNLVAARMARQAVLTRASAPQFFAVVDEGTLRRPIGEPGVMHRQLHHLLGAAGQPHVTLRVCHWSPGLTPACVGRS